MLTIVIPNRNRSLTTVQRTLSSLASQCIDGVTAVVVDYGSAPSYQEDLQRLVDSYKNITTVMCPTQGQLWQKTRAINIALKQCNTPFFMVADMDMIFHSEFVQRALELVPEKEIFFFQVGILTEEESAQQKGFHKYQIKFKTNEEATGITLFPTAVLKDIHGFDEFYHGWGAEDTDVHIRLSNAGYKVHFYNKECLLLHQWHPKNYRSKNSRAPFHPVLEKINQRYLALTKSSRKIIANRNMDWGVLPEASSYKKLDEPEQLIKIDATQEGVDSFLAQLTAGTYRSTIRVEIIPHIKAGTSKEILKKALGKSTPQFLKMSTVNQAVLSTIVNQLRNQPYRYTFDRVTDKILLDINLSTLG